MESSIDKVEQFSENEDEFDANGDLTSIIPSLSRTRHQNSRSSIQFHSEEDLSVYLDRARRLSDTWFLESIHQASVRIEEDREIRELSESARFQSNEDIHRFYNLTKRVSSKCLLEGLRSFSQPSIAIPPPQASLDTVPPQDNTEAASTPKTSVSFHNEDDAVLVDGLTARLSVQWIDEAKKEAKKQMTGEHDVLSRGPAHVQTATTASCNSSQVSSSASKKCCGESTTTCCNTTAEDHEAKPLSNNEDRPPPQVNVTPFSELSALNSCPSDTSEAGRADMCQGCPGRALCQSLQSTKDPDLEVIAVRMNAIRHKILILSGKGGVGKSTVAANLSIALARLPHNKVGLLDLDICGPSVPQLMGVLNGQIENSPYGWKPIISPHNGVKTVSVGALLNDDRAAIIWRGPRKTHLIKQFLKDVFWGKLDFLVFDTPPGTSDEHISVVNCLKTCKPDGAIIVMTSQKFALPTIRKEITFCNKMGIRILGIVENMSRFICPCCSEDYQFFDSSVSEELAAEIGVPFLGSIPIDQHLGTCADKSRSIFDAQECSVTAGAFDSLVEKITSICQQGKQSQ